MRWIVSLLLASTLGAGMAIAQTPPRGSHHRQAQARGRATMAQVMRGIYFPNANLIFDVQQRDPGAPPPKSSTDGGTLSTTETFGSIYGGWQGVENAAIALTESVDLLMVPGRTCQNGKPVPVRQADWVKYSQGMREAGQIALQTAKSRNREAMIEVTNQVADACANCHEKYRDMGEADSPARCTP